MQKMLLIAPEGIEIRLLCGDSTDSDTLNRTRRNWNTSEFDFSIAVTILLIAPEGIEINMDAERATIGAIS